MAAIGGSFDAPPKGTVAKTPLTKVKEGNRLIGGSSNDGLDSKLKSLDSHHLHHHPHLTRWACSALSSLLSEAITYPVDTIRIHQMQLRTEHDASKIKWSFSKFARLYSGLTPALQRSFVQGGISMSLYTPFREYLGGTPNDIDGKHSSLIVKMTAAAASGGLGQAIANPLDVAKTILQAHARSHLYVSDIHTSSSPAHHPPPPPANNSSTFGILKLIYQAEGVKGLYSGLIPSVARSAIINGAWMAAYDVGKIAVSEEVEKLTGVSVKEQSKDLRFKCLNYVLASQLSGIVCCIVSGPLDVVKTRLFTQSLLAHYANSIEIVSKSAIASASSLTTASDTKAAAKMASHPIRAGAVTYAGAWDCMKRVAREEGFFALWRGFIPAMVRTGPWSLCFFALYETLTVKFTGSSPI